MSKKILFAIRFFTFSALLSLLWLYVSSFYVRTITKILPHFFSMLGYKGVMITGGNILTIKYQNSGTMLNAGGIFFDVVLLLSLIMATSDVDCNKKVRFSAAGLLILYFIHILFIISFFYGYVINNKIGRLIDPFLGSFLPVIFPFLLWVIFFYRLES